MSKKIVNLPRKPRRPEPQYEIERELWVAFNPMVIAAAILLAFYAVFSCASQDHEEQAFRAKILKYEDIRENCQKTAKSDADYGRCIGVKWEDLKARNFQE